MEHYWRECIGGLCVLIFLGYRGLFTRWVVTLLKRARGSEVGVWVPPRIPARIIISITHLAWEFWWQLASCCSRDPHIPHRTDHGRSSWWASETFSESPTGPWYCTRDQPFVASPPANEKNRRAVSHDPSPIRMKVSSGRRKWKGKYIWGLSDLYTNMGLLIVWKGCFPFGWEGNPGDYDIFAG